ncbi:MAG: response regulator [Alphaproteobacteria bacterium]|nr:response regulator [Alphaproteobacteria bacterium]
MRNAAHVMEPGQNGFQPSLAAKHALIVDDMPVMMKILGRALSEMGITFDHVENGSLALEALGEGTHYDMIFMDIMMPVMDGVEATKRIRALEKEAGREAIPIFAVTTKMSGPENATYMKVGMTDCIKKPVDRVSVEVMLGRHLTGEEPSVVAEDEENIFMETMEAVNWDTFREYNSVLKSGMVGLIEDYLIAAPSLLEEMGKAVQARQCSRVYMFANQFKSASVTFGAEKVAHLAAKLEICAGKEDEDRMDSLFFDLHIAYEHTKQALKQKLIILKNS